MRNSNRLFALVFIIVCSFVLCICLSATEQIITFDTTRIELTGEEASQYESEFSLRTYSADSESYEKHFFFSFDVSSDGNSVLLFDNGTVVVLDSYGRTLNILKFDEDILNTRVRSAAIKWNENDLELMLGYGISYLFTTDGEILDIWRYESEMLHVPNPSKLSVDDYTYEMKSSNVFIRFTGGGNYDKLVRTKSDGEEKVIFEASRTIPEEAVGLLLYIVVFNLTVGGVGVSILVSYKKRNKKVVVSGYEFKSQGRVPGSETGATADGSVSSDETTE